jgi:ubiquinone/menaquinone biosynthesis C-methylase UbiE
MNLRTRLFLEVVCSHIPEPPARVLEVGCGKGNLALALAERGFDVTAIDPNAPDDPIFRRVRLEDFSDEHGFDAVVASMSLHHIHDLDGALDTIASFLPPAGPLVVDEWAPERLAGRTAHWYFEQRRALAQAGRTESDVPDAFDAWERQTAASLADLHSSSTIRSELEPRFAERLFEWRPFLYSRRLDDTLEPLEQALIDNGGIDATGFRYVGERR